MSRRDPALLGALVTFDRPEPLAESLAALASQTRRLDALVVVDNAPSTRVERIVVASAAADRVVYVPSATNLGPAGGIALGMERFLVDADDDDWVCILDDDDPLTSDDELERHMRIALASDVIVAGVGGGGATFDAARGRLHGVGTDSPEHPVMADYLKSGWCPLYRVRAIREVGVFDRELFFGFDDLEFGLRLRSNGWTLLVCGALASSSGGGDPAWRVGPLDWRRYYSLRNLVHLLRAGGHSVAAVRVSLTAGLGKPIANLVVTPRLAWSHLALNARAVRDGWNDTLGQTVMPSSARRIG